MPIKFHLYYWPILTTIWVLITFITSYLVAVFNNHVYELFPYISDTGSLPPESCIFGQMLNIAAFLMFITMYIRFRTVALINHRGFPKNYLLWNKISNIFGGVSCLGMSLVANFQETSEINVHFIGAFLTFVVGAVYCGIQAYLTWLSYTSKYLKSFRILLASLLIPMYVSTSVASALSFKLLQGDAFKWRPQNQGYELHLVATFSEWIMAILMMLYVSTYWVEFKNVKFTGISFILEE